MACDNVAAPAGFHYIDWMIPFAFGQATKMAQSRSERQASRNPHDRLSRVVLFPNAQRTRFVPQSRLA